MTVAAVTDPETGETEREDSPFHVNFYSYKVRQAVQHEEHAGCLQSRGECPFTGFNHSIAAMHCTLQAEKDGRLRFK